jgi:hypothetical protein
MAQRRLLSPLQWNGLLAPPVEEQEIVRHYTLSRADLDLIAPNQGGVHRHQIIVAAFG